MIPSTVAPNTVIVWLWLAWIASWFAAAAWTNKTEKRLGAKSELFFRLAVIVGVIALVVGARVALRHAQGGQLGPLRLWSLTQPAAWACAALVACGFAFCWWARIHLGKLWS